MTCLWPRGFSTTLLTVLGLGSQVIGLDGQVLGFGSQVLGLDLDTCVLDSHDWKVHIFLLQDTARSRRAIDADLNITSMLTQSPVNGRRLVPLVALHPDQVINIIVRSVISYPRRRG